MAGRKRPAEPPAEDRGGKGKQKVVVDLTQDSTGSDSEDDFQLSSRTSTPSSAGKGKAKVAEVSSDDGSGSGEPATGRQGSAAPAVAAGRAGHDGNDDECFVCGKPGELLCCDGCPAAYHFACAGVAREVADQDGWLCSRCVRDRRKQERQAAQVRPTPTPPPEPSPPAASSAATAPAPRTSARAPTPSRVPRDDSSAPPVRVMGPTSALTSFLAEKGISARRIREQHFAATGSAAAPNGATTPAQAQAPMPATAATATQRPAAASVYDLSSPAALAPSRARLRFEVVLEPVTEAEYMAAWRRRQRQRRAALKGNSQHGGKKGKNADAGKGKDKGKGKAATGKRSKSGSASGQGAPAPRKRGRRSSGRGDGGGGGDSSDGGSSSDDDYVDSDGEDEDSDVNVDDDSNDHEAAFSSDEGVDGVIGYARGPNGEPLVRRRVAVCGLCNAQLPTGVLRCPTCAATPRTLLSTTPAAMAAAAAGGRKRTRAEGSLLDTVLGRVASLQDICIKSLCERLDDVESFGDIADAVRDRICKTVCRLRQLNDATLRLFLFPGTTRIALYDCARLSPQAFLMLPPVLESVTSLELEGCGRMLNEHLMAIVQAAPQLVELTLGGAFLITDHTMQLALRQLQQPLERLCLSYCPRIGTGTMCAVADRGAHCLRVLKLRQCESIRDADLAPLTALRSLTKLHIVECPQLTDASLLPLLAAVGDGLTAVRLSGCSTLCAAANGLPVADAHTLPVALPARPAPAVRPVTPAAAASEPDGDAAAAVAAVATVTPVQPAELDAPARRRRGSRSRRQSDAAGTAAAAAAAEDGGAVTAAERAEQAAVAKAQLPPPAMLTAGVFALLGPTLCNGSILERLEVASTAFDDVALTAVLETCGNLERLDLTRTLVTGAGIAALVAAPCTARLTHLSINRIAEDVPVDTLLALAATTPALRRLDVSWMRTVDDVVVAAFRKGAPTLEYMAVWGCNRLTEAVLAVAERPPLFRLVGAFFLR